MEKYKEGWQEFIELCRSMKDDKKLSTLFDLLLTPQEREDIAMRCLIIRELVLQEHTQRDIAKKLNVSIAKITRGSNEIKRLQGPFFDFLQHKISRKK